MLAAVQWLLILHLLLVLPRNAIAFEDAEKEAEALNLDELLSKGEYVVDLDRLNYTKVIAIIGMSGTGKSTFKKLFLKNPTLQMVRAGTSRNKFLFSDGGDKISSVNETHKSKTLIPNTVMDPSSGALLIDCPGFSDTRGVAEEIAASFMTKKILDKAKEVKFIVMENHPGLTAGGDRYTIRTMLRHLAKFLPDIDRIKDSIALIANKAQRDEHSSIQEDERDVTHELQSFRNGLTEPINKGSFLSLDEINKMKKLIDIFIRGGRGNNIAIIYKPNKEGSPWDIDFMNECHEDLKDLVENKLKFSNNIGLEYNYSISAESIALIKDDLIPIKTEQISTSASECLDSILEQLKQKIHLERSILKKIDFIENTMKVVLTHQNVSNLYYVDFFFEVTNSTSLTVNDGALKKIKAWEEILQFFFQMARFSPIRYSSQLKRVIKFKLIQPLTEYNKYYTFLKNLNTSLDTAEAHLNREDFKMSVNLAKGIDSTSEFSNVILQLGTLKYEVSDAKALISMNSITKEMYAELNTVLRDHLNYVLEREYNTRTKGLTVKGKAIILSEVKAILQMYPEAKSIKIFAWHKIFIDGNFQLSDTNLAIVAPLIDVLVPTHITSTGSDAVGAAEAGKNSGHIFITTLEIQNPSRWSISTTGGKGGKGTKGTDGACEFPSSHPSFSINFEDAFYDKIFTKLSKTKYKYEKLIDKEWRTGTFFMFKYHHKLNLKITDPSYTTKPATNGGPGGSGGHPGKVEIKSKKLASLAIDRKNGANGIVGDPGQIITCFQQIPFVLMEFEGTENRNTFTKDQGIRFNSKVESKNTEYTSNNVAPIYYNPYAGVKPSQGNQPLEIPSTQIIDEYINLSSTVNYNRDFVNFIKK
ncbi:uncharacterized protein LOC132199880 [Neocloeon triangulifer]|uniref:uncharacterized protein LOC132199880 n=1 Tax=Neocloeon triangulifer TaxID=2078957 RepID=UPI00286F6788|nr:uncharacterized protein LOC132199880 [Neocloeon triangulifer]XP_059480938.1 uncharacterized protein LOC132199880 [Neocloeon triangulifer]